MGDDVSKILDFFDICQAFCSRTPLLLDVSAAVFCGCGGWFFCLQTVVFCGIFSENLRPGNHAVKKKTLLQAFLAILSPFMSIRCDAEAGDAIYLFVRGTNLRLIASSR